MRLFLLGATGGTGRLLLDQALDRGHDVTAFVRSPDKITQKNPRLTVRAGDPRSADALAAELPGHDAVLSALGPPARGRTTVLGDTAKSLVDAMKQKSLRRVLVVSSALLFPDVPLFGRFLRRFILQHVVADSREMERVIAESGLDWTIARPPRLLDGPGEGKYRAADDALPGSSVIDRADVARFLLDAVEREEHVRKIVGVCR